MAPSKYLVSTLAGIALLLTGCSAEAGLALSEDARAPSSSTSGSLTSQPPPQGSADTGLDSAVEQLAYWSVSGVLEQAKTDVDVGGSTLEIGLWNGAVELVCTLELPLLAMTQAKYPDTDAALFQWVAVDHDAGVAQKGDICPDWPEGALELGIGLYDSALNPAMDAAGMLGSDVYGLYVRPSVDDPVYLVGIAQTDALLEGTEVTVSAGPLPVGTYAFETLVLLTYPF